jgi:hypothetical protein
MPSGGQGMPSGGPGGSGASGAPGGSGGNTYGKKYYWIAIIGEPSTTESWQWQFGGHHVTVNATIKGEDLSLTPSSPVGCPFGSWMNIVARATTIIQDRASRARAVTERVDPWQN